MPREREKIIKIIEQNKNVPFVDRIINKDKYPTIKEGDYDVTHKMAWGESEGKYYVFPTVEMIGGKLVDLGAAGIDPLKHALDSNNFISFDNAQDADSFSKNYKSYWGNPVGLGIGK